MVTGALKHTSQQGGQKEHYSQDSKLLIISMKSPMRIVFDHLALCPFSSTYPLRQRLCTQIATERHDGAWAWSTWLPSSAAIQQVQGQYLSELLCARGPSRDLPRGFIVPLGLHRQQLELYVMCRSSRTPSSRYMTESCFMHHRISECD